MIQEKELRALQRANQYQQAEMKKDQALQEKLWIIDHWNYKERFKEFKSQPLQEKNQLINSEAIANYIEKGFEPKDPTLDQRFYGKPKKKIEVKLPSILEKGSTFDES